MAFLEEVISEQIIMLTNQEGRWIKVPQRDNQLVQAQSEHDARSVKDSQKGQIDMKLKIE